MDMSPDSGQSTDVREALTPIEAVTPEQLVRVSPFPVYGLVDRPHGLELKGLGYCSAPAQVVTQSPESWLPDQPHILLQVTLDFEARPTDQRAGRTCELITIDSAHWPADPEFEHRHRAQVPHYGSPDDLPLETTEATGFVVERFPIVEQMVEETIHRQLDATATWTFSLQSAHLWVEGRAKGWTQTELLTVLLGQVAAVSHRSDVLAQYQRELADWRAHIKASVPAGGHVQRAGPSVHKASGN